MLHNASFLFNRKDYFIYYYFFNTIKYSKDTYWIKSFFEDSKRCTQQLVHDMKKKINSRLKLSCHEKGKKWRHVKSETMIFLIQQN